MERVISIKGELNQQIRALETIYVKLCSAYENGNARALNYSPQYYQQQLMQHFAQQAAMVTTVGSPLLPTHYPQHSIIHQTQTNNSNNSSNKYIEQPLNSNGIYHPSYYVSSVYNVLHNFYFLQIYS